jgi:excisionase family DNA binding protein
MIEEQMQARRADPMAERQTRTVGEAAAVVGVHPLTLRRAIARGEIRAVRVGRRVLVPLAALDAFLASDRGTATRTDATSFPARSAEADGSSPMGRD